ncbi:DUF998 domain-containing protein [Roseobacter sp. CCS2]|uniref:DUF998 domain-containing protein n=1 Tax=Roseobacter sp. CCS2 TaxID=391593 RepID=UPI0000F3F18D|nr:DUF998 domain-containing protein [Roseobacter sp. CCS2]EBA11134.1 hypothetical protein RCCS2_10195 [Roseobacter sp. CCS2]
MNEIKRRIEHNIQPNLLIWTGWFAIAGCVIFTISILIADFVVPDHDWIADTISDLGAGRYEFIVDIGIYAYSAALVAIALAAAHLHLGGPRWSIGVVGLSMLALLVFLIGARNEYGDNDNEGVVIHIYLVYGLGVLMALVPWLMSGGASKVDPAAGNALIGISIVWTISAPVFFYLPTDVDGIFERYLGLISFALVIVLARVLGRAGRQL